MSDYTNVPFGMDEAQFLALPEIVREKLIDDAAKKLDTVRQTSFKTDGGNQRITAKVGQSGNIISVSVPGIQVMRPGLQFRPATIDRLWEQMGAVGLWLKDYLEDMREQGQLNEDAEPGEK